MKDNENTKEASSIKNSKTTSIRNFNIWAVSDPIIRSHLLWQGTAGINRAVLSTGNIGRITSSSGKFKNFFLPPQS
jgi:hypothetical protein